MVALKALAKPGIGGIDEVATIVVVITLAPALLAGCIQDGAAPSVSGVLRISGDACDPSVISNCLRAAEDGNVPWIVRDVNLSGDGSNLVGIEVSGISRSLVVRDFRAEGFAVGVRIKDVDCTDCTITLENGVIESQDPIDIRQADANEEISTNGIQVMDTSASMVVRNLSARLSGGGAIRMLGDAELRFGGSQGFHLRNSTGSVTLTDASFEAATSSVGYAVAAKPLAADGRSSFRATNVSFSGFYGGFDLGGQRSIALRSVQVDCGTYGIRVQGANLDVGLTDSLRVHDLNVSGCSETGLSIHWVPSVEVVRFNVSQSKIGVYLQSFKPDTFMGPLGTSIGHLFRDGLLADNNATGLRIDHAGNVTIDRARFLRNGQANGEDDAADRGGLVISREDEVVVSNSSFDGNARYGATVWSQPGGTGLNHRPLDARHNWWGDANGPRVQAGDHAPVGLGDGDVVTEDVLFTPFLTSPP